MSAIARSPFEVLPGPQRAPTTDPRVPARDRVVTRDLMDRFERECPDKVYIEFGDNGEQWTYRHFRTMVIQTAIGLQQLGVAQGDHVLVWLPNSREHLRVFFAINYLGAVFVPINTAYKGAVLAHVIDNADAKLAIVHADLAPRLEGVPLASLKAAVVVGERRPCPGLQTHFYADVLLPQTGKLAPLVRPIEPWDSQSIIYTSGTTGPSKGVLSSYLHIYTNAGPETWTCVTGEDRFLVNMPLFHIGGMGVVFVMFVRGGSVSFIDRFDTATFLDTVRRTKTTTTFLLGVMASFLEKLPERADDADTPLRLVFMVPLAGDIAAFSKRFGCEVYTIFNMTEISTPIISEPNPLVRGTCGKQRPGVDVRLVDDNDCEVPIGSVGEMLVAHDELDLAPGTLRLKRGGGSGGHNGLKDISAAMGSPDYGRLRIGIGHPRDLYPGREVIDFVLARPSRAEQQLIDDRTNAALELVPLLVQGHWERAGQKLHTVPPKPSAT